MPLNLSAIYIYPVKSLPPVSVHDAVAEDRGLAGDRRWMLVDEGGRFISLREERQLLHFVMEEHGQEWCIRYGDTSLLIPKILTSGKEMTVTIWEDSVLAWEGEAQWSEWFSSVLGRTCKLVYMPPEGHRPVKSTWQLANEEVSFADGYPYLLVNDASLTALSEKTGKFMDARRFRPNLVFSGGAVYDEFTYREVAIGEVILNGLKPCIRCVVVTLDPETGEQSKEPLKTLATEAIEGNVVFGQHATIKRAGCLSIGDTVTILKRKDSPYEPL